MNKNVKYLVLLLLVIFVITLIIFMIMKNSVENKEIKTLENQDSVQWAIKYTGSNFKKNTNPIKIAILDSGINKKHKEFEGVSFKEYNALVPCENIKDDYGHGTAIAGIIAAKGIEITGVFQNVIIYDVKVLDEKGRGKIEDVVEGIEWSIKEDVDIINISFGFSSEKAELKSSIEKAIKKNIIITAATGNTFGLTVDYPAQYDEVLSISSFDKDFKNDPLAGIGKVDYSAPGVEVVSTDNMGDYSIFSGTSFATAYATGVIASILNESSSDYNFSSIKGELVNYVVELGEKRYFGEGFLTLQKEKVVRLLNEKDNN